MLRQKCSVCENNNFKNIYKLDQFPIKLVCNIINLNNDIKDTLSFIQCDNCLTIQLSNLIPLEILYSNSHNFISNGETWNNYFKLFSNSIKDIIFKKNILEIGCPSGKIVKKVNDYNKWYIVDPNKNDKIEFEKNVYFIKDFFNENFNINDNIDVIIHSHLFEHIYEPNIFLNKCYNILNDNGEMFFGIPNMDFLANKELSLFLGVFFEHTIFLNDDNVKYLLNKNGFELINVIYYENHSILYHTKKINLNINNLNNYITNFKVEDKLNLFYNTLNKYKDFINRCNQIIENNNNIKDVYLFGASYNTQYLLTLGIDEKNIKGILDNSIEKEKKYFYGFNLIIYNPSILLNNNSIVILKNGYYVNEIKEQILSINPNTCILE
jgi:SAM-dependent methyltransferase